MACAPSSWLAGLLATFQNPWTLARLLPPLPHLLHGLSSPPAPLSPPRKGKVASLLSGCESRAEMVPSTPRSFTLDPLVPPTQSMVEHSPCNLWFFQRPPINTGCITNNMGPRGTPWRELEEGALPSVPLEPPLPPPARVPSVPLAETTREEV